MKQPMRYSRYLTFLFFLIDVLVVNLSYIVYFAIRQESIDAGILSDYTMLLLLLNITFILARSLIKLTLQQNILFADKIIQRTFYHVIAHGVLFLAALAAFQIEDLSRYFIAEAFAIEFVVLSVWRICFRLALRGYRRRGNNYRNIVILGTGSNAQALYREMTGDKGYGYRVLGFFNEWRGTTHNIHTEQITAASNILGNLSQAIEYISSNPVEEVYCAYTDVNKRHIREIMQYCERNFIAFYMVPALRNIVPKPYELNEVGVVQVIRLHREPLQEWYNRLLKRIFDIVFSLFALLLLFVPIFIIVAPIIKLSSPGPIFFRQRRNGEQGQVFWCYKFRSMVVNKESETLSATRSDPRKTKIGNIIRKTSIDELPQFYNVLRGDMSVVGPRPHMLEHTRIYSELVDKYMLRHHAKPGITGWAQIHGLRGEIPDIAFMARRVEADVWYIEHWSLFLDIKIIYKTVIGALLVDKHAI